MSNEINEKQKWDEYEHLTGLYGMYIGTMINLGIFSFAIIGGITTYVLGKAGLQRLALVFPLLLSLGLTYIFIKSYRPAIELIQALDHLGDAILHVELKPHAFLLKHGVILFGLLYFITSVALFFLGISFCFGIGGLS